MITMMTINDFHGDHVVEREIFQVEILVCGSPTMDMAQLKKVLVHQILSLIFMRQVVVYDGYKSTDDTITHFWEVNTITIKCWLDHQNVIMIYSYHQADIWNNNDMDIANYDSMRVL